MKKDDNSEKTKGLDEPIPDEVLDYIRSELKKEMERKIKESEETL